MAKSKPQILLIHGGMTFKTRKDYLNYLKTRSIYLEDLPMWSQEYLDKKLGPKFQIIRPRMPLKENAKYDEWKIYFERHIPFLQNNIILIGVSLGGIFLAKYLSENKFPKKILSTFLICPPFDNTLSEEDLVGGFKLKSDLSLFEKNCKHLHLLFSQDDPVVPAIHAAKYREKLDTADIMILENKNGHFIVPEFPELLDLIKEDQKKHR